MTSIAHIIVAFAAVGGFSIAFFIRHKKQKQETMVCPLKANCDTVIHSEYARFLGIPLELMGMTYYALVGVGYALFVVVPSLAMPFLIFLVLGFTISAFLFSLYLTFIQAFVLKQWCSWCLMSASLCFIIFIFALLGSQFGFVPILIQNSGWLYTLHFIGIVLGTALATITEVIFLNFLRDFRISLHESDVLRNLSQLVWLMLALVILAGFGLYLAYPEIWYQTPQFVLKVIILLLLVACGAAYGLAIAPRLVQIAFKEKHQHFSGELHYWRRLAFAFGGVVLASWYALVLLEVFDFNLTLAPLFALYLLFIALAVAVSQLIEKVLDLRSRTV